MFRLPATGRCRRWLCLLLAPASAGPLFATPLNDVQEAAAKWADLRSETTRLESEWLSEKALLDASISHLESVADQLQLQQEVLIADAKKAQQEVDQLTAENQLRAGQLAVANAQIARLAAELAELRPALPPRLSAALDLPFRTITNPELSPADLMRHTMTILNRCQQFDQTFVLTEEVLPVTPDGQPRLLEVVYFGLAQACALDRSADEAFIGRPFEGVWQWEYVPGLAPEAVKLIDVRQDTVPPEFVELPVKVMGGAR